MRSTPTKLNLNIQERLPQINELQKETPILWLNPQLQAFNPSTSGKEPGLEAIHEAEKRLQRFAPLLAELFPELKKSAGKIESDLIRGSDDLLNFLKNDHDADIKGTLWIKGDHYLPVAGSVKARGGIYEVLCIAEKLAVENNLLSFSDNYRKLNTIEVKNFFNRYTVSVGSTGNLGLSIGIMATALGFKSIVHMSTEAKGWKKERLRNSGVIVVEHDSDYTAAVRSGREQAMEDSTVFFVDDEKSKTLFLGYSVAVLRLKDQMKAADLRVGPQNPLFVYLPCGVGGAPGGIGFGLKQIFGDHVHCFFMEPVKSPSMLLGLATNFQHDISIYDIGLNNDTHADGLAVSKGSKLVGSLMKTHISGVITMEDNALFRYVHHLDKYHDIRIEPSAAAGFSGPPMIFNTREGRTYLKDQNLENFQDNITHLVWTTGGRFLPEDEFNKFRKWGKKGKLDIQRR